MAVVLRGVSLGIKRALPVWSDTQGRHGLASKLERQQHARRAQLPLHATPENAQQVACGGSLHSGNTFWKN
jgi:hypothetical protein